MKKIKKGFTLIELLVVVLIIGILAAVALPQYQTAVGKARYQQALTVAESMAKAQRVYYLANGSYTRNFDELDVEMPAGGTEVKEEGGVVLRMYSWGNCYFGSHFIQCRTPRGTYQTSFDGKTRYCIASASSAVANQVCKAETGQSTSTYNSEYSTNYYRYP